MQFSAKVTAYQNNTMLNICDAKLLGQNIIEGKLNMHISKSYYGEQLVNEQDATQLLQTSSIINMVGEETISLSLKLGIGSKDGVKIISNVPFLLVFKM